MSTPAYPFAIQEPDWAYLESRNTLELAEASVRRTDRNRAKRAPLLAGAGLIEPVSAEGRLAQWQAMLNEQRQVWEQRVAQVMERYRLVVQAATPRSWRLLSKTACGSMAAALSTTPATGARSSRAWGWR